MPSEPGDNSTVVVKFRRYLTLPTIVVGTVVLAFVYVHVRSHIIYAGVEIGMDRQALTAHLGPPRRVEQRLIFCAPYFPWSGECVDPRPGGEFLFFKFGIDRWIVTGVDSAGIVWFKTLGDT